MVELRGLYPHAGDQKLKEMATLGSRDGKRDVDIDSVKKDWEEKMHQMGYSRESILDGIIKAADNPKQPGFETQEYLFKSAEILTEQESTFTRREILKEAGKLSIGHWTIDDLEKSLDQILDKGVIISLRDEKMTTMGILKAETRIVNRTIEGRGRMAPVLDKTEIKNIIEQKNSTIMDMGREGLKPSQMTAIEHILTSSDTLIGVQGDAGSGKTTVLGMTSVLAGDRVKFQGLAYTGKAATELEAVGIEAQTIHSFLSKTNKPPEISNNMHIWLVDEASMVGTKLMDALLTKADAAGAKVVLIGDTKQLQAVDAGNMFKQLQDRGIMKTVRMDEVVRQRNPEYLDIVKDVSSKRIDSAFERLSASDKIIQIPDRGERIKAVISEYTTETSNQRILVTSRNSDRHELNHEIRSVLRSQGKLFGGDHTFTIREAKGLSPAEKHFAQAYSTDEIIYARKAGVIGRAGTEARIVNVDHDHHTVLAKTKDGNEHLIDLVKEGDKLNVYAEKERSFAKGDKIVFLKNDKMIDVNNGTTGFVKNIDDYGNLTATIETGKDVTFHLGHYPYIDHGYAVTTYKSQGQTAREVVVYTDTAVSGSNYNSFYVSITRGKDDVRVYTDDVSTLKEQVKNEQIKSSTLDHLDTFGQPVMHKDDLSSIRQPQSQGIGRAHDGIEI